MPKTKGDDLAGPRRRVFSRVRARGLAAARPIDDSELVPGGRPPATVFCSPFSWPPPAAVLGGAGGPSPLLTVSALQRGPGPAAMTAATFAARHSPWRDTYRRLALGALVGFVSLTLSNYGA